MIGKAITQGSQYLPIRHLAGRAAATAPAKDYLKQIEAVFNAITKDWWRYTFDPVGCEVLTIIPERIFDTTLGRGKNNHCGYGDCDDITIAAGALLNSIGFQTRIATSVRPGSQNIFDHVFLFVKAPGTDWICFDPVLYPRRGLGDIVDFKRMALWNHRGKLIKKIGPFPPRFDAVMRSFGNCQPKIARSHLTGTEEETTMQTNYHNFPDYSDFVGGFGEVPVDRSGRHRMNADVLPDFQRYGIAGFGCYNGAMGYMTGDETPNVMAEVDENDMIGDTGLVRTKHFELDPADYAFMVTNGTPRTGTMALSDDGEVYSWQPNPDGLGGLFKRLARRVKKRVKRRRKKIRSFAKRIGRKKFFRLGKRVLKTAMKVVKPLIKRYGGKIMQAVAPIAGIIPGVGPFISTALVVGGKAYDKAQMLGIKFDKFKRPKFKSMFQAKTYKNLLKKEARKMGKRGADKILKRFEMSRGMAGSEQDLDLWKSGVRFRTVDSPGFGWC